MNSSNLNALRDRAYKNACEHGFHDTELSNEHLLCLVISELMEAVEADRKNRHSDREEYDRIIHDIPIGSAIYEYNDWFRIAFENNIKGSVEEELADAAIRLLDLAGLRGITISFSEEDIYESTESCNGESFTESIYAISTIPIRFEYEYDYSFDKQINSMLLGIIGLANYLGIDLMCISNIR